MGLEDLVLVANFGSTSLKMDLYDMSTGQVLASAHAKEIGKGEKSKMTLSSEGVSVTVHNLDNYQTAATHMIDFLTQQRVIGSVNDIAAVGYKAVHAGNEFSDCHECTPAVMAAMKKNIDAAPIHNPIYLNGIHALQEIFTQARHIALFEGHFHKTTAIDAHCIPIPFEHQDITGIQREIGFHGASHHYIRDYINSYFGIGKKIISIHLGGSSSICAIDENGNSVATTMGYTPEQGLIMGTRGGSRIPYATAKLIQKRLGWSDAQMDKYLTTECGLKAICDEDDLEKIYQRTDDNAVLARTILEHQIAEYIAAYDMRLGKADLIVFTGGAGEKGIKLRENVLKILMANPRYNLQLNVMDGGIVSLDPMEGPRGRVIATEHGQPYIVAVATNENLVVAQETYKKLKELRAT